MRFEVDKEILELFYKVARLKAPTHVYHMVQDVDKIEEKKCAHDCLTLLIKDCVTDC